MSTGLRRAGSSSKSTIEHSSLSLNIGDITEHLGKAFVQGGASMAGYCAQLEQGIGERDAQIIRLHAELGKKDEQISKAHTANVELHRIQTHERLEQERIKSQLQQTQLFVDAVNQGLGRFLGGDPVLEVVRRAVDKVIGAPPEVKDAIVALLGDDDWEALVRWRAK